VRKNSGDGRGVFVAACAAGHKNWAHICVPAHHRGVACSRVDGITHINASCHVLRGGAGIRALRVGRAPTAAAHSAKTCVPFADIGAASEDGGGIMFANQRRCKGVSMPRHLHYVSFSSGHALTVSVDWAMVVTVFASARRLAASLLYR